MSAFNGFRRRQRGGDGDFPPETRLGFEFGSRLAAFKTSPSIQISDIAGETTANSRHLFQGACSTCTPNSASATYSHQDQPIISQHGLANILATKFTPLDPLQLVDKTTDEDVTVLSLKRQIQERQGLISMLDQAAETDEEHKKPCTDTLLKTFSKLALNLRPLTESFLTRILQRMVSWVLYLAYPRGIIFHPGHLEVISLSMVSEIPMVFIKPEGSLLDSAIVQTVLRQLQIRPIRVASTTGNTLPMSSLERGSIDTLPWQDVEKSDHSDYNWAVQAIVVQGLLKGGHDFLLTIPEWKPTLKECNKRKDLLFLQLLVDELLNVGEVEDVFLVPVTVSHEATFEQRFGTDRITIWSALKLVTSRVSKALFRTVDPVCGASRINFEQPFRLSEMVKNALEQPRLKQLSAHGDQVEETSALVKYTVSHLLWAFSRSRSLTPTELLAFMKRSPTLFRSSSKSDNLLAKVEILRNELHYRGFDTSFSGDSKDVIRYAQDLLGRCEILDVSKLSKALKPMFLYEGVVALSVCSLLKVGSLNCHAGSNAPLAFANYDQVMEAADLLASLLESHCPGLRRPCQDFHPNIAAAIDRLKVQEIILGDEKVAASQGQHLQDRRSHRLANLIDFNLNDPDDNDRQRMERESKMLFINTCRSSLDQLMEWRNLLLPEVRSIYLTLVFLTSMIDVDFATREEVIVSIIVSNATAGSKDQQQPRLEPEMVSNSLNRLEEMQVIDSSYTELRGQGDVRVIWLTEEYNKLDQLSLLAGRILPYIS